MHALSGSLQGGFQESTLSTVLFFLRGSKITSDKFFATPGKVLLGIPIVIYIKNLTHPADEHLIAVEHSFSGSSPHPGGIHHLEASP